MMEKTREDLLRKRAEEQLEKKPSEAPGDIPSRTGDRFHELMRRQVELELYSEDLLERQKVLEGARDYYRDLFEGSPVAMVTIDSKGALITANQAAQAMLKTDLASLSDTRFHRFIRPGDRARFDSHLDAVFGTRRPLLCEIEMRRTNGAVFYGQIVSVQQKGERRHFCQTAIIDISNRKRFEEEMEDRIDDRTRELNALNMQLEHEIEWRKQTEERLDSELDFRTIIEETIPVGICVFDTNGRLIHANNHLCDMLGFSRAELLETYPPYPFWPADAMLERMAELKNFIEHADIAENVVRKYRKKDGKTLWGLTSRIKMKDQHGKSYGILGSVFDITPRKTMEEELRLSERKLRTLSVKLMEAGESERKRISKELHDSIGSALTAIQFAMERKITEMGENACSEKTCLEDILPMLNTVADEVRRISKNLHPSVLEDLGIRAALRSYGRQFQKLYAKITLEQVVDLDEAAVPEYLKLLIYRIVQESLANAAKHGQADHILLKLSQRGRQIELLVRDNGVGFDVNRMTRRDVDLNGLGLESMKERTEHVGGIFEVSSMPGAGAAIRAAWTLEAAEADPGGPLFTPRSARRNGPIPPRS